MAWRAGVSLKVASCLTVPPRKIRVAVEVVTTFSSISISEKSENALLSTSTQVSGVQINPNREQLRAEETDRGGIAGAARQLIREPVLALAWIIVGE